MSKADTFFAQNRLLVSQSSSMGDKRNLLIAFEKWLSKPEEATETVAEQVTFPLEEPQVRRGIVANVPEIVLGGEDD